MIPKDCKRLAEVGFPNRTALRDFHELMANGVLENGGTTGRFIHDVLRWRPDRNQRKSTPERSTGKPDTTLPTNATRDDSSRRFGSARVSYRSRGRPSPRLREPIRDPARLEWHEVTKVAHYYLSVDTMSRPMRVREEPPPYNGKP